MNILKFYVSHFCKVAYREAWTKQNDVLKGFAVLVFLVMAYLLSIILYIDIAWSSLFLNFAVYRLITNLPVEIIPADPLAYKLLVLSFVLFFLYRVRSEGGLTKNEKYFMFFAAILVTPLNLLLIVTSVGGISIRTAAKAFRKLRNSMSHLCSPQM